MGVGYEHPVGRGLLLRPSLEYERLHRDLVQAHYTTARLAIGYRLQLTRKFVLIPEAGLGYGREERRVVDSAYPRLYTRDGFSTWLALNPRFMLSRSIGVGASIGYKAIFLEYVEGIGHSGYNRQAHALVVGTTVSLHF